MERINRAPGFVDAATAALGGPRTSALLERLNDAADWDRLVEPIRALPEYQHTGPGRRPWDAAVMFKAFMLQRWFSLSDPQLEEQLKDRLSFRRFVGLSLDDDTPDETTYVIFRDRLRAAKLERALFAAAQQQLDEQGLLVREGTIVDATIIEQSRGHKRKDGTSTRDAEASSTFKHGRPYHGYKAHVATDFSGLVTDYQWTTAKVHDSQCIDGLTADETHAVIADSAYSDAARRRALQSRGVIDGIMYKRHRGQAKLRDWQLRWNRAVSKVRAFGEHPFAHLKHHLGWRRVRYRGQDRNRFDLSLRLIAYNLKRSLCLSG
ncbi:MAG: IS5 family transposase [Phycisphaeraceae bacterium]|jgi:IS5 family transposase|nr:IS5 family transposase [Phycisphaeraceae bacterium]